MKAKANYDSGYLKVRSRTAGDFGFISVSSEYEDDSHLKELKNEIENHLRGYLGTSGGVSIEYDLWECGKCGCTYETRQEAEQCCLKGKENER